VVLITIVLVLSSEATKLVELRLLMNPVRIEHSDKDHRHVSQVVFERAKLEGEPGKQQAIGTGEMEVMSADLVIVSVGYKGDPLEGMGDGMFDNGKGIISNIHGKVPGQNNLFATGWIKRGPTGIIGTNIIDAKDTVATIMKYITSEGYQEAPQTKGRGGLIDYLNKQGVRSVSWDQFLQIDQVERDKNRVRNDLQPREKILSIEEMLDCIQK
jgi:NADPH-dependent glutamate synthase beta subunit-like oxidoreductase